MNKCKLVQILTDKKQKTETVSYWKPEFFLHLHEKNTLSQPIIFTDDTSIMISSEKIDDFRVKHE
jgi:hypothetical protein